MSNLSDSLNALINELNRHRRQSCHDGKEDSTWDGSNNVDNYLDISADPINSHAETEIFSHELRNFSNHHGAKHLNSDPDRQSLFDSPGAYERQCAEQERQRRLTEENLRHAEQQRREREAEHERYVREQQHREELERQQREREEHDRHKLQSDFHHGYSDYHHDIEDLHDSHDDWLDDGHDLDFDFD